MPRSREAEVERADLLVDEDGRVPEDGLVAGRDLLDVALVTERQLPVLEREQVDLVLPRSDDLRCVSSSPTSTERSNFRLDDSHCPQISDGSSPA